MAAADVQGSQRSHRDRAILDPAHARSLQSLADDLATCFRRAATDVPTLASIPRIVRAMTVVLEVTDQLAQLLMDFRRSARHQFDGTQECEQGFTALFIKNALGLVLPLRAGLLVVRLPHLGERAQVFGRMIPVE